jgi:hypothetical protein
VGSFCVLAAATLAVYQEVYVDCGVFMVEGRTLGGRCHDLRYAVSMVLGPLVTFGAFAGAAGSLAGLAIGMIVLRRRKSP